MKYDPAKQHRRSLRLRDYDYTQAGAYFITIVTHERTCFFGEVLDGDMQLNDAGRMVQSVWDGLPAHYPRLKPDEFVVMPNHVHGVIILSDRITPGDGIGVADRRAGFKPAPTNAQHGLSEIIRALKTFSARRINELRQTPGASIWQRNYFEHVIRDEESLNRIRQYIQNNPARWEFDPENREVQNPEPADAWRI
jgi:putative transposase